MCIRDSSIAQKLKNIDGVFSIKAASDEVSTNFEDPEFIGIVKALKHHINICLLYTSRCV